MSLEYVNHQHRRHRPSLESDLSHRLSPPRHGRRPPRSSTRQSATAIWPTTFTAFRSRFSSIATLTSPLLMPVTGSPAPAIENCASFFDHDFETTAPHYYQVLLERYDIQRGIHRHPARRDLPLYFPRGPEPLSAAGDPKSDASTAPTRRPSKATRNSAAASPATLASASTAPRPAAISSSPGSGSTLRAPRPSRYASASHSSTQRRPGATGKTSLAIVPLPNW